MPGASDAAMLPAERLRDKLVTMNGKGFQVYQELAGAYRFERFVLYLDSIQSDPMAAPTRARVRIDQAEAQIPRPLWDTTARHAATSDYVVRRVAEAIRKQVRSRWSGRLPPLAVDAGGQAILARTACAIGEDHAEVRLAIGLPAEGRKVLAKAAQTLLFEELPAVVDAGLVWANLGADGGLRHVEAIDDYLALRDALASHALVAFVADGSTLPRDTGPGDGPMRGGRAIPIRAPEGLAVTVTLPHRGTVRGLGIRRGVTIVTGGAFSGKSTLLEAIGSGAYPHVPGDGRELVATVPDAVSIRSEPGRRIERVDVSAFVREVPQRHDVTGLSLEHASGALSMAAATAEALEVGTSLLLYDEDDAAIAFMARDAVMQQLVPPHQQPLAPLVDRLRALWESRGVSSIVATSGLGDYLDVADTVVVMEGFQPLAATERARGIVAGRADRRAREAGIFPAPAPRYPVPRGFAGLRGRRQGAEMRGRGTLTVGRETVDIAALEQLVDPGQARAAGDAILYAVEKAYVDGNASIAEVLDRIFTEFASAGLDILAGADGHGDHALPRRHEVAAILNRMRTLQVRSRRANGDRPLVPAEAVVPAGFGEPPAAVAAEDPGVADPAAAAPEAVDAAARAATPDPNDRDRIDEPH